MARLLGLATAGAGNVSCQPADGQIGGILARRWAWRAAGVRLGAIGVFDDENLGALAERKNPIKEEISYSLCTSREAHKCIPVYLYLSDVLAAGLSITQ